MFWNGRPHANFMSTFRDPLWIFAKKLDIILISFRYEVFCHQMTSRKLNTSIRAGNGIMRYKLSVEFCFVQKAIQSIQIKTNLIILPGDFLAKLQFMNFILSGSRYLGLYHPVLFCLRKFVFATMCLL